MDLISGIRARFRIFLPLLLLGSVAIGPVAQAQDFSHDVAEQSASAHQGTILNLKEGEVLINRGHWTSRMVDGYNCIRFRGDGSDSWNISKCFELGTFEEQAEGVAMLTREAGTLILNGELGPETGEGRYSFTPDRRFNRYLRRHFDTEEVAFSLPLFLGNMQSDFMDFLEDHYGEIEAGQVTQLALYDVNQGDFEAYLSLYREYAGQDPTLDEIVETKINGIDMAYVDQLQEAGYDSLDLDQMMQAKAHGVTTEVIEGLAEAGFTDIPLELLLRTRNIGLSVETAKILQNISQEDLALEAVIELQKRNIDKAYIDKLEAAGLMGLDLQQVTKAKALNLDGSLREALKRAGMEADYNELIVAKAANVDTALVRNYMEADLQGASLQDMVVAKQYGLDFSGLEAWKELGAGEVNLQELLQASALGLGEEDLEAFRQAGVEVYSLAELISAKIHGVDIAFIQSTQNDSVSDSIPMTAEMDLDALLEPKDQVASNQEVIESEEEFETGTGEEDASEEEAAEIYPKYLHQYISLKLAQDARLAQEAIERRQNAEVEDQEAQDRGFYQLELLGNPNTEKEPEQDTPQI